MPCRSDHMEPRGREIESKDVANHLVYLLTELKRPVSQAIKDAAESYYGNSEKCDEFTALLCGTIQEDGKIHEMHAIVYNGRKKKARSLADWWDCHQEHDAKREAEEAKQAEYEAEVAALTPKQKRILGFDE